VSKEIFSEMVKEGKFLEWANVHDNSYGTSIEAFTAGKSSM
jgi:guanylate kinase